MAKQSAVSKLKTLDGIDTVGRNKAGNIVARRGFFYTHGRTAEEFANYVHQAATAAGLKLQAVASGEKWLPFSGGAPIAKQSHWWVELKETV